MVKSLKVIAGRNSKFRNNNKISSSNIMFDFILYIFSLDLDMEYLLVLLFNIYIVSLGAALLMVVLLVTP